MFCLVQAGAVVTGILHYYRRLDTKVVHRRSKLILLQIICVIVADLEMIALVIVEDEIPLVVMSLLGIDIMLLFQLTGLYRKQKMMDAEVPTDMN